jgi:hypothetical protein
MFLNDFLTTIQCIIGSPYVYPGKYRSLPNFFSNKFVFVLSIHSLFPNRSFITAPVRRTEGQLARLGSRRFRQRKVAFL